MMLTADKELSLYAFQKKAEDDVKQAFIEGHLRVLVCSPTGSGKTELACKIMKDTADNGQSVAFFADRQNLIKQTSKRLFSYGINHGVYWAGNTRGMGLPIQVVSAQTCEKRKRWPDAKLWIIDEVHIIRQAVMDEAIKRGVRVIGLSATPFTEGLGNIFTKLVNTLPTKVLQKENYIVPLKVFVAKESQVDVSGLKLKSGEWAAKDVSKRVIPIVGNIVADWFKFTNRIFGGQVPTLCFSASVDDGAELCRKFQEQGIRAEQLSYLDGSDDDRAQKIEDFDQGKITILISCEVLGRGSDFPRALCLIDARPYRNSLAAHLQKLGRIMRTSPGKEFGLVLDHTGDGSNYRRFEDAAEDFWANGLDSLSKKKIQELKERSKKKNRKSIICFGCDFVMPSSSDACPSCGKVVERVNHTVHVHGVLEEYEPLAETVEDGNFWPHLCRIALEKHPQDAERAKKFALAQFKNLTGEWPPRKWGLEPCEHASPKIRQAVDKNLRNWIIKQRRIGARGV